MWFTFAIGAECVPEALNYIVLEADSLPLEVDKAISRPYCPILC